VIALIDYGAGNLTSVKKALAALGADVCVPTKPDELTDAAGVIVPGVGHFRATTALTDDWREAIVFEGSAEAPELSGLGLMTGLCERLPAATTLPDGRPHALKIPHVGWNSLHFPRRAALFDCVDEGAQVYFTHAYAAPVTGDSAAVTTYGVPFASAVERGQVFGVQFHPEKSGDVGLQVLRNFLSMLW